MSDPSTSTQPQAQAQAEAHAQGPAGLGVISSLSPTCTPLKHRYDSCFNRWFEDYLGEPSSRTRPVTSSQTKLHTSSSQEHSKGGFWASRSHNSTTSIGGGGEGGENEEERKRKRQGMRDRLDGECGSLFREYQACVLQAVKEKQLEPLIQEARTYNPFPFPKDMDTSKPHRAPFPFPAGEAGGGSA